MDEELFFSDAAPAGDAADAGGVAAAAAGGGAGDSGGAAAGAAAATDEGAWLADLQEELASGLADADSLRRKLQGRSIPTVLRAPIWQVLLNVSGKPDALAGQKLHIAEHDCPIKNDCSRMAERFLAESERAETATEMETILGFYCRTRGAEYTQTLGWAELLAPLALLPLSRGDRYSCFYAIMSKYAFRDCVAGSACFHVFRLLLLYHDPELCNYLDSRKIEPEKYAQTWFRSLFVQPCSKETILPLWDAYLVASDSFFVFFMALVMLVNARDLVFQMGEDNPEELVRVLATMPEQLEASDIPDMCDLAMHYASITPHAFRSEYGHHLFAGAKRPARPGHSALKRKDVSAESAKNSVFSALCLPLPVDCVLRRAEMAIKYFVVDTRPLAQFDAGHLPHCWHLDAQLMLSAPKVFADEVARLQDALEASMHHPCFLGSGREEEDQYQRMLVAHFLNNKQKYVSIVQGGYEGLHYVLDSQSSTMSVLDAHNPNGCLVCVALEEDALAAAGREEEAAPVPAKVGWGAKLLAAATRRSSSSSEDKAAKEAAGRAKKQAAAAGAATAAAADGESTADAEAGAAAAAAAGDSAGAEESSGEDAGDKPDKGADGSKPASTFSARFSTWSTALKAKSAAAAAAAKETSAALRERSAKSMEALREKSRTLKERLSSQAAAKNKDAAYRGAETQSMFSIDDDDDDFSPDDSLHNTDGKGGGADLDLGAAVIRREKNGELWVDSAKVKSQPNVLYAFQCNEVQPDGYMFPGHLVLTASHVIKLRERNSMSNEAVALTRRELARIVKITAKKKHPNLLTFVFEADEGPELLPSPPDLATSTLLANTNEKDPASSDPTLEDSESPKKQQAGGAVVITERFMVPEATEAKAAFRDLIAKIRS